MIVYMNFKLAFNHLNMHLPTFLSLSIFVRFSMLTSITRMAFWSSRKGQKTWVDVHILLSWRHSCHATPIVLCTLLALKRNYLTQCLLKGAPYLHTTASKFIPTHTLQMSQYRRRPI